MGTIRKLIKDTNRTIHEYQNIRKLVKVLTIFRWVTGWPVKHNNTGRSKPSHTQRVLAIRKSIPKENFHLVYIQHQKFQITSIASKWSKKPLNKATQIRQHLAINKTNISSFFIKTTKDYISKINQYKKNAKIRIKSTIHLNTTEAKADPLTSWAFH